MDKEFESVLKTLGEKIQSLESNINFKDWRIKELEKQLEELKHIETRPLVEPKEVEER